MRQLSSTPNKKSSYLITQANTVFETFKAFTPGQLSYIQSQGMDVLAVCSFDPQAQAFFHNEGVRYVKLNMSRNISLLSDIVALLRIIFLIRREKPDLIQGSTPKAGFLFMLAAWIMRVPARLFFMRGVRSSGLNGKKKRIVRLMEKITCTCAYRVLCTSKSVMEEATREGICPAAKIQVLANGTGNGINTDYYSKESTNAQTKEGLREKYFLSSDSDIIIFVGRLAKDKGVEELYNAWELIYSSYPKALLVMVGKEDETDLPPAYILEKIKKNDRIRMVGSSNKVRELLAIADIFVLPTYREGIPISLLEASSMELPVITSRVTGCVDAVIENQTGKLVPAKNHKELADAIEVYLNNKNLRLLHGKQGRQFVQKKFSPKIVWETLLTEYRKLIVNAF